MNIMCLDLEMNQPNSEIIEVGIAIGNLDNGQIVTSKSWFILTKYPLDPFIQQLCSIKQSDVDGGTILLQAYKEMLKLYKDYDCFVNLITWGGGDTSTLKKQLENMPEFAWQFGRRWIDAKTVYQTIRLSKGLKPQGGLARAMTYLNMNFKGTKHRAIYDAENTFKIYYEMMNRMKDINFRRTKNDN